MIDAWSPNKNMTVLDYAKEQAKAMVPLLIKSEKTSSDILQVDASDILQRVAFLEKEIAALKAAYQKLLEKSESKETMKPALTMFLK